MKRIKNVEEGSRIVDLLIHRYRLQITVVGLFIAIWLVFYAINRSAMLNPYTYTSLLSVAPFTIILAISLTLVIIAGEMDLSFPSIMALGSMILALTWRAYGPTSLGLFLGLMVGLAAGLLNGVLVAKLGIPSLIATIGTMFLWRGVVMVVTQGFNIPLGRYRDSIIFKIFVSRIYGLPVQFLWAIALAFIFWLILNRHKLGAYIYYIGDNRAASRMLGINTDRVLIILFGINGTMAALAGIMVSLELASFWPALGEIYLLEAIAAVVVGGTPITGGVGTILGSFFGGLILEFIGMGILAAGVSGFWIQVVYGLVIVIALAVQSIFRREEIARIIRLTRQS